MSGKAVRQWIARVSLFLVVIFLGPRLYGQKGEIQFGIRVWSPSQVVVNREVYDIVVLPRFLPQKAFETGKPGPKYMRPIVNLDIYAVKEGSSDKTPIQQIFSSNLEIRIQIDLTPQEQKWIRENRQIALYLWDIQKNQWIPAVSLKDEIYAYDDGVPGQISFKIKGWCIDDRGIGAGG